MAKLVEITGKALSGEWGTDDETGDGIPILRTTNFTNEGVVDYKDVVTRTITKKNIDEKYLRSGDIIIEKSGGSDKQPVGRVIYFDGPEKTYLFNNFTGLLRVKNQEAWFPKYVFYSLYGNYRRGGTRPFENKTTGLHNLKTDDYVSRYEVAETDYKKQVEVCEHLDRLYNVIKLREEEIQKLDDLIKARFVEMFGGLHNSKLYPYVSIETFTDVTSGGTPNRNTKEYWENGNIRWVKTTELHNNFITDTEEYITRKGIDNSSAKVIPAHSILVAMYGQGKTRGMTGYLLKECTTNQACACILPCKRVDQKYLWYYMILSYDKLRGMAKGGNQPNLNIGIIKRFQVLVPPIELQSQFADFVNQVNKSKVEIQQALEKTQLLFDSLMQQYFG